VDCARRLSEINKEAATSLPEKIQCPKCNIGLTLEESERNSKKFTCPNCNNFVDMSQNIPPPEDIEWYYAIGNEKRGPVSPEIIIVSIKNAEITPNALVWTKGLPNWIPFTQSDLGKLVTTSPPPLPTKSTQNSVVNCVECGNETTINVGTNENPLCQSCYNKLAKDYGSQENGKPVSDKQLNADTEKHSFGKNGICTKCGTSLGFAQSYNTKCQPTLDSTSSSNFPNKSASTAKATNDNQQKLVPTSNLTNSSNKTSSKGGNKGWAAGCGVILLCFALLCVICNQCGSTPHAKATSYLMDHLKDPSSLEIIGWSDETKNSDGSISFSCRYRAKNGFGGFSVEEQSFTIIKGDIFPY
jgi:hypothetical protein